MRTPNSGNATDNMAMCHRKMPYDHRPNACMIGCVKNRDSGASAHGPMIAAPKTNPHHVRRRNSQFVSSTRPSGPIHAASHSEATARPIHTHRIRANRCAVASTPRARSDSEPANDSTSARIMPAANHVKYATG
ncbi:hypothetical protein HMPREF1650_07635 [Corynebacterium freneyi DNF00450]|uniref:Uncharacterized protein n=1 Tax=Corynebacterium freneyi DNF00450 TaxID=1287475 RepID=A0A095Y2A7_9CORY|nr:hypothetical protein HMPREF1650_07635 [Corynebacterium freneyi DNF00450]